MFKRKPMSVTRMSFHGTPSFQAEAFLLSGGDWVQVVGEAHHQEALSAICGGKTESGHSLSTTAVLVMEPDNPHDSNAIAVIAGGNRVGYLGRQDATAYRPVLEALEKRGQVGACQAEIRGGWDRGGGDEGHFGISLNLGPPESCLEIEVYQPTHAPASL